MTDAHFAFATLDSIVSGMRFNDGSTVRIEGSDTMLFFCKNGEHWSLLNVYYLPRLTANIISIGQLDKAGYEVLVKGGV